MSPAQPDHRTVEYAFRLFSAYRSRSPRHAADNWPLPRGSVVRVDTDGYSSRSPASAGTSEDGRRVAAEDETSSEPVRNDALASQFPRRRLLRTLRASGDRRYRRARRVPDGVY